MEDALNKLNVSIVSYYSQKNEKIYCLIVTVTAT